MYLYGKRKNGKGKSNIGTHILKKKERNFRILKINKNENININFYKTKK